MEILNTPRPQLTSARNRYRYFPGVAEVPEAQAVNIRNRDYIVGAWIDIPAPGARASCSPTAHTSAATRCTSRTTGCTTTTTSWAWRSRGSSPTEDLPVGDNLIVSAAFVTDAEDKPGVALGSLTLYHGEEKVGERHIKTQPAAFGLTGSGLTVGHSAHADHL